MTAYQYPGPHQQMKIQMFDYVTTNVERDVLYHLQQAWEVYTRLEDKHPDDDREFVATLHNLQRMVALRVARRVNPEVWAQPTAVKQEVHST